MKYIIGFIAAVLVITICHLLTTYLLKYAIPQFFVGWISCTAYFAVLRLYEMYYE